MRKVILLSDYTPDTDGERNTLTIIQGGDGDIHISTDIQNKNESAVRIALSGSRFNKRGPIIKKFNELLDLLEEESQLDFQRGGIVKAYNGFKE